MSSLLDTISGPEDVKRLSFAQTGELAEDLRAEMIAATSLNGGHLASSLGAVEIVLAAYRVLDLPHDKLLFDVGHQAYAHKMLTGRRDGFALLRKAGGASGFTRREESPYDVYDSGHASDSLATACGLALARDLDGGSERIVTVIGDASLAGGLSYEALNVIGQRQFKRFAIVLNDNEMSISRSVGALSSYLAAIRTDPRYTMVRDQVEDSMHGSGRMADVLMRLGDRAKQATKQFLVPGMLFEDMNITYLGPFDGHDVRLIQETLARALEMGRPVLIHAVTRKGKGYAPAERNPELFHGIGPFDPSTGAPAKPAGAAPTCTQVLTRELARAARRDPGIVAVAAAMTEGTGLAPFAREFPERTYDVGIAEECAVTMAAGLALGGKKPVVCIYSTFLQRAFDEISTNVCLPNLHVVFAVDRAGLVGEDGSTHHGEFDIAYLRMLPNMRVAAPSDADELTAALRWAFEADGPVAVRYPRGAAPELGLGGAAGEGFGPRARVVHEPDGAGEPDACVLALGRMVAPALEAARSLEGKDVRVRVLDMRWAKPVDADAVRAACACGLVVTVEDGVAAGGFGSAVLESMAGMGLSANAVVLGLPDAYVGHGCAAGLYAELGLDAPGIARSVERAVARRRRGEAPDEPQARWAR